MKLRILIVLGGLCAMLFLALDCRSGSKDTMSDYQGVLINKLGTYRIEKMKYKLHVGMNDDKILWYVVRDDVGEEIIKSIEQASCLQKWSLYWDTNNWLWVESSDIGGFVWKKEKNGSYKQYPVIDDANLYKIMPQEIFEMLPTSTKKKWQSVKTE